MQYLEQLLYRRRQIAIKNQAIFGIVLGSLLMLFGGWNYYLAITEYTALWKATLITGILAFFIAVACPALMEKPYRFFNKASEIFGKAIFSVAIGFIYFAIVFPFGLLARVKMHRNPFHHWDKMPPQFLDVTWEDKSIEEQKYNYTPGAQSKLGFYFSFLNVISFFLKKRYIIIIPSLVVLILLGIMFFFIQGSALAPFIYTLF
jgi:hypothetical protein